jgi:hypothetical protein
MDPFNRVLPQHAVPMFTQSGEPIGVGPDGNHYLPDGTIIDHAGIPPLLPITFYAYFTDCNFKQFLLFTIVLSCHPSPSLVAPHYDVDGHQLNQGVVDAANAVADKITVAIKVRARMQNEAAEPEAVDVLGRTFRPSKDKKNTDPDVLINADGQLVPVATARRAVNAQGEVVPHQEVAKPAQTGRLVIKVDDEGEHKELGTVSHSVVMHQ